MWPHRLQRAISAAPCAGPRAARAIREKTPVIFVTLEDETGSVNIIVWRHVRERQRTALLRSRLLAVAGQWQAKDGSTHLIARRLVDVTPWLGSLATNSRDFH